MCRTKVGGGLCTAPSNPFFLNLSNVCRTKVGGGLCTAPLNHFFNLSNVCRTKVGGGLCTVPLNLSNVCRAKAMGWGEFLKPIFDLCRINARGNGRFV